MGVDYIDIEENSNSRVLNKEYLGYIFLNLFFIFIGLFNLDFYIISIKIFIASMQLVFGYSLRYGMNLNRDSFIKITKVSCLICAFIGIVGISGLIANEFKIIILILAVTNLSTFLYLTVLKNTKFKVGQIIYIYSLVILMYIILDLYFSSSKIDSVLVVITIIMTLFNSKSILNKVDKEYQYYNLMKNLSLFALATTMGDLALILLKGIFNESILLGVTYLILFNYVYYGYRYTVKFKIAYPAIRIHNINEKLNRRSEQIHLSNKAIHKEIIIQETIKNSINQRNELLTRTLEMMPNIWMITDYNFNILDTNNKFKEEFSENIDNFRGILEKVTNKQDIVECLKEIVYLDSIIDVALYINDNVYMLNISNNRFDKKYLISLNDITTESKMEEELKNIKYDYEKIIDNIPSPIIVRSANGDVNKNKIVSVNKKFEKDFGYFNEEIENISLGEYCNIFKLEFFDSRESRILHLSEEQKKDVMNYNDISNRIVSCIMEDKYGMKHITEVRIEDYLLENELLKLLTFKDVTKEMCISEQISDAKEMHKNLLDVLPEAMMVEDMNTDIVLYTNKSFRRLFCIKEDRRGVVTQKYRNKIIKEYIYNLHRGNAAESINIENEDGKTIEVRLITKNMHLGEKRCKLRIIKDIGEEKKAERIKDTLTKQRKYDKLKMEFYANISHELKTPLNNIYSSVQLVENLYNKDKIKDNQDVIRNHIRITKQNMFRLLRLIENIINISQVKSELYKVRAINFDIIYISECIVESIYTYAESKNIKLIFDTNEESLIVGLDPESIERIILNILSNSIKFTLEKGKINVGIYKENDTVEIIIKDTGVGIEKEKLDDIFERFKQIENSGISNEFGSGIGLCLTKSLVELQCGKIYIDSKIGEGTTVKVIFPIKEVVEEINDKEQYNSNIEKFEIEFFDIYK